MNHKINLLTKLQPLSNKNFSPWLWLVAIAAITFYFLIKLSQGFALSDSYEYLKSAYNLGNGAYEFSGSVFHNRPGIIIPEALAIKFFGTKYYSFMVRPWL